MPTDVRLPDLPDWVKELGTCGLGVPNVFMIEKHPFKTDPGYPFWLHWHDTPGEAPRWVIGGLPLHTVVSRDPWHIEASILCAPGCGLHGFIRNDEWVGC